MNRSASPFASGHRGVILRWWNPKSLLNVWNSFPLKGRPLLVFTTSGIPWQEKIMSRCGITVLAEVDEMTSTSGNLLYSSMTTRRYSPNGKGPARSTATSIHGPEGRVIMESGTRQTRNACFDRLFNFLVDPRKPDFLSVMVWSGRRTGHRQQSQ